MNEPNHHVHEAVLRDLLAGPSDLRRLATRHKLKLDELVAILDAPETAHALRVFTLAGDASAAIAIARARHNAIAALKSIVKDTEHPESARKAAVDLIKAAPAPLSTPIAQKQQGGDAPADDLDEATQELIRKALGAFQPEPPEDPA